MMRAVDLFKQYRKSINPPYEKKDLLIIFGTLLVLIVLPFTVFSLQQRNVFTSKGAGGEGSIRFLSKLTDLDSQWRNAGCSASNLTCSVAQMMNASYEAIMVFDCSICREFGNAFTAGPTFVYQDPTMIRTDGSSDSPGVDLNDVLLTTTGQRCWQTYFNGSRYLADVTQQDVQNEIVAKLQSLVANSAFDAIYIDVAEAYLPNAADCSGGTPAVSNAAWMDAWATLAERMQNEVAGPLILNSQYVTWNSLVSTSSTNANRFWAAPDAVEIEFGWPFGRHGEGTANWQDKINYINRLHGLGTGVFVQDYPNGTGDFALSEEKYGLAMYLLAADAPDYYGTFNHDGHGSGFFSGYNADLGAAQGPFYNWNGLQRRDFASGFVLVNNPGGGTITANLGGSYTSLWNETMSSITLAERNGNVFRTSGGGGGGDTQDPSVSITSPSNGAVIQGSVNITATATDNVGVDRVEFWIDGALKDTDSTSPYSYSWDTTLGSNGSHNLQAKAYDAAGNAGLSVTVSVSVDNPSGGGQTVTFTPTGDATIQQGFPSTNYGSSTIVEVDSSPLANFLLKLSVSGIGGRQVTSAKLRLYNTNPSNMGGTFYSATSNSWVEGTVTWNNAPAVSTNAIGSLGLVSAGNWYEVDVGSIVAGDGTYSFRVNSSSSDGADYSSKEGSFAPSLVVTFADTAAKPGDLNYDGVVNIFDASILASKWGTSDPVADINKDGVVNIFDASILATNWGT